MKYFVYLQIKYGKCNTKWQVCCKHQQSRKTGDDKEEDIKIMKQKSRSFSHFAQDTWLD